MPFSLSSPPSPFPTYLVPSLPFRRRKSSIDSTISTFSTSSSSSSPPPHDTYLSSSTSHLRCTRCLADLALSSQIISKGFTGRHGRAYLVSATASSHHYSSPTTTTNNNIASTARSLPNLPNTYTHKPVPRQLVTGAHTVADVSCAQCGSVLGWKYVAAEDESQRYKVGKFILETKRVCRVGGWDVVHEDEDEDEDGDGEGEGDGRDDHGPASRQSAAELDDVEFDSQDEDECDALFAGQWTARFAREARRSRGRTGRAQPVTSVEE